MFFVMFAFTLFPWDFHDCKVATVFLEIVKYIQDEENMQFWKTVHVDEDQQRRVTTL